MENRPPYSEAEEKEAIQIAGSTPIMANQSIQNLKQMGKGTLAREIQRLNGVIDKLDMLTLVSQARKDLSPKFQHREAFMVMLYRSIGGTDEKLIWNSRDGVTPFTIHIDGMEYTHDIPMMRGPYFDRPEGIIGQWETRTEAKMMEAWHRVLERAVLAGRMSKEKAAASADAPDAARSHNLNIGLRSMVTGRYTDEVA